MKKKGEAIIITRENITRRQLITAKQIAPCIFEYVYFARQDSIIDGISVYKARLAMGEALADEVEKALGKDNDIDVVIPVSLRVYNAALHQIAKFFLLSAARFLIPAA